MSYDERAKMSALKDAITIVSSIRGLVPELETAITLKVLAIHAERQAYYAESEAKEESEKS